MRFETKLNPPSDKQVKQSLTRVLQLEKYGGKKTVYEVYGLDWCWEPTVDIAILGIRYLEEHKNENN